MGALAEVNGDDASTDWLDAVFARFCFGKEPALAHHGAEVVAGELGVAMDALAEVTADEPSTEPHSRRSTSGRREPAVEHQGRARTVSAVPRGTLDARS